METSGAPAPGWRDACRCLPQRDLFTGLWRRGVTGLSTIHPAAKAINDPWRSHTALKAAWARLFIAWRCRWCFSTASAQSTAGGARSGVNDRSRQIVLQMLHRSSRNIIWRREVARPSARHGKFATRLIDINDDQIRNISPGKLLGICESQSRTTGGKHSICCFLL